MKIYIQWSICIKPLSLNLGEKKLKNPLFYSLFLWVWLSEIPQAVTWYCDGFSEAGLLCAAGRLGVVTHSETASLKRLNSSLQLFNWTGQQWSLLTLSYPKGTWAVETLCGTMEEWTPGLAVSIPSCIQILHPRNKERLHSFSRPLQLTSCEPKGSNHSSRWLTNTLWPMMNWWCVGSAQ